MDTAVREWLLAQLGAATPLADLEARYARLGTARAVALEVLRSRLAALIQQPTTINVSGAVAVGFAENIKALERQITALEAGIPPAPDDPATSDPGDTAPTLGVFFLRERPRR